MAIKVNGKLVAGLGKSAYEQAQEGGYTGTEEEFISALANIGSNPTAEGLPVNDVRTGTVRDGQSIAAGDVVNVRALGKTVAIQWNGEPTLFRAVQVGNPDPSIYDASCDGIWVMAVDRLINMVFGSNNDYKSSNVHTWCNGDFINGFETELQKKIKTVKIPYWDGTGTEGSLKNGVEGLSTKGFLPSLDEFGHPSNEARSIGSVLSAFQEGDTPKTISNYFICRNPSASDDIHVGSRFTGNQTSNVSYSATQTLATTPCFILPLDTDLSTIGTVVEDNYDVYRDVVAQKNVENRLNTVVMTGSDLFKLNESYSILIGNSSSNPAAYLIDNTTGKSVYSVSAYLSAVLSVSGARLDDTHFVMQALTQTTLFAKIGTVNGTSISFGEQTNIISAVTGSAPVVALEADRIMSIFTSSSKLGIGISLVNGTTITQKQTYYLPGNVNAGHISATRIPDDNSGNRRVCICFSDTGDGNKGKAVIATVDSANAVTFGEVVTFSGGTIYATSCAADKTGNILVGYIRNQDTASKITIFVVLNAELNPISNESNNNTGNVVSVQAIVYDDDKFACVIDNYAKLFEFSDGVLGLVTAYNYNANTPDCLSAAAIEKSKILIAFANRSNSSYGTTTTLEISGNQIAGSFLNNSKDAIALESGKGGNIIKLGFGGYCACEGTTAGQTIDSEGVTAYSPLDGWLEIKDPWAKGYVTGEYTGDGTYGADNPTVIDVGFRPECLIIGAESANSATGAVFVLLNGVNLSYSLPNGGAVNVSVNESQILFYANSASGQMNASGSVYRYIAWR